jgi:PAS domain S-box-containing protein
MIRPTLSRFAVIDLSQRNFIVRYGVATVLVLIATLVNIYHKELFSGVPFILYFAVVTTCARFTGFGSSVYATIISTIITFYLFLFPSNNMQVDEEVITKALLFILISALIISFSYAYSIQNKALIKSAISFQNLIANSVDGIAKITPKGQVIYLSPSVEKISGYSPKELIHNNEIMLTDKEDREKLGRGFLEVIKTSDKSITITHKYVNKQGELAWMDTTFTNMLQVEGVNAIVANFRDVTSRHELEQKRMEFLGVASHEIKSPLTSLKLNIQLISLATEVPDIELIKRLANKSQGRIDQMLTLLEDLLNISKFESGTMDLKIQDVLSGEIIKSSIQTFHDSFSNKVDISGDLTVPIRVDKNRMEQVLVNLLNNAAKYSRENSEIKVDVFDSIDRVKVCVTDRGIGIPASKRQLLFKKFERLGQAEIKGFGLGLYISSEIVKAHNGEIGVESEENKGSTFWFTIPKINNSVQLSNEAMNISGQT